VGHALTLNGNHDVVQINIFYFFLIAVLSAQPMAALRFEQSLEA
jgi:hypothetical protein